jgi:hypothetical protein
MFEKTESFTDSKGNSITITTGDDGVTVFAHVETLPPYTGGADATAARAYAKTHGLKR